MFENVIMEFYLPKKQFVKNTDPFVLNEGVGRNLQLKNNYTQTDGVNAR
jgi:hypothetical protein